MEWLGYQQPVFSFLDASYYLNLADISIFPIVFISALVYMNLYWIVQLSVFVTGQGYSNTAANLRKFMFMFSKNVLFLPLFNVVLE